MKNLRNPNTNRVEVESSNNSLAELNKMMQSLENCLPFIPEGSAESEKWKKYSVRVMNMMADIKADNNSRSNSIFNLSSEINDFIQSALQEVKPSNTSDLQTSHTKNPVVENIEKIKSSYMNSDISKNTKTTDENKYKIVIAKYDEVVKFIENNKGFERKRPEVYEKLEQDSLALIEKSIPKQGEMIYLSFAAQIIDAPETKLTDEMKYFTIKALTEVFGQEFKMSSQHALARIEEVKDPYRDFDWTDPEYPTNSKDNNLQPSSEQPGTAPPVNPAVSNFIRMHENSKPVLKQSEGKKNDPKKENLDNENEQTFLNSKR